MLRTSVQWILLAVLAVCSGAAVAKTDSACLDHLGGGYGDTECYHGLSRDLETENKQLYKSIKATIPVGNVHAKLLTEYMASRDEAIKYCPLQRDAGAKWDTNPDGSMYPAMYEQCIYDIRNTENKFLKDLLTMATWP